MTTDRVAADRAGDCSRRQPTPATALSVSHLDVTYRVRGQDRLALRDVSFPIGRGESYGLVGESGSGKSTVALALVRYLPSNGRVSAGTISINGLDPLSMGRRRCGDLRARTVSMVYQEPGRALNPSIRVGPADRRGVRDRRASLTARRRIGRGDAAQGADLGPGPGHAAVPARAVRRDGAAGRHRDGAGRLAVAADPGRADDRARRHRRGRSARPGRGAAPGVRHLGAVHQPQPGGDRQDVRPGRRALRGRAGRGRARARGLRRPAAPVHGRAAALHPAARAAQGQRTGWTPSPASCPRPAHDRPACVFAAAVRARRGSLPGVAPPLFESATCGPRAASSTSGPRTCPAPRPASVAALPRATDRRAAGGGRGAVEDLRGRRPGAGRRRPVRAPGRDARAGGRVGQRQDHAGARRCSGLPRRIRARSSPCDGTPLSPDARRRPRETLRALQIVFQNPDSALNRRHTVRQPDQPPAVPAGRAVRARRCATGWPS